MPPSRSAHRRRLWTDDTVDQGYVLGVSRLTPRRLDSDLQHVQTLLSKPLDATAAYPTLSEQLFQSGDSTAYLHLERSLSSLRKAQAMSEDTRQIDQQLIATLEHLHGVKLDETQRDRRVSASWPWW